MLAAAHTYLYTYRYSRLDTQKHALAAGDVFSQKKCIQNC